MRETKIKQLLKGRFDLVILCCLVDYALLVLISGQRFLGLATVVPVVATVVIAHYAAQKEGNWRTAGRSALALALVLAVVNAFHPTVVVVGLLSLLFAFSMVIAMVMVYTEVLFDEAQGLQSMYAALSCYLLVGIIFSFVFATLGLWTPHFFAQSGPHVGGDYAYFSAITMTTVGYGDLSPGESLARSLAVLEAIMGQIVLVTLVARTVASVSSDKWRERRRKGPET